MMGSRSRTPAFATPSPSALSHQPLFPALVPIMSCHRDRREPMFVARMWALCFPILRGWWLRGLRVRAAFPVIVAVNQVDMSS